MKKMMSMIITILLICSMFSGTVYAQSVDQDFRIKNGVLIKYTGSGGVVEIPETVTEIRKMAFYQNETVTEVVIPETVTAAGKYCFSGCTNLKKVTLPSSLTVYPKAMFSGCTALEEVVIPDGVTTWEQSVFSNCSSLHTVQIPESMKNFGSHVFADCTSLENVNLPKNLEVISWSMFSGCENLKEIEIPVSVTKIEKAAFNECKSLETVVLPEGLTEIASSLFSHCHQLKQVNIPTTVKKIGGSAFYLCYGLAEITIPNKVVSIGSAAFSGCDGLVKIVIPKSVTEIGRMAFWSCEKLKEIEIPTSVTHFGDHPFSVTPFWDTLSESKQPIIINDILLGNPEIIGKTTYLPDGITGYVADAVGGPYIVIPPSVTNLDEYNYNDAYDRPIKAVYGVPGSFAEQDAKAHNVKFIPLALKRQHVILKKNQTFALAFNSGSTAAWRSSDPTIVTVDQTGKLTAKANGTATVTATLYGKEYSCKVTVSEKAYTVKRGDTLWGIAARELGDGRRYQEIMEINGLRSTLIHRGKKLWLPE